MKKNNNLNDNYPELAKEWHPTKNGDLKPTDVTGGSNKKVWWLGKCGHEWCATIASRTKGVGCPFCAGIKALSGFNDLQTLFPELAVEWHPTKNGDLKPSHVRPGSDKIVWWKGSCGHEWRQRIANRKNGSGCPYCKSKTLATKAKRRHLDYSGSLADKYPLIANEWHPTKNGDLKPSEITAGYNKPIWWLGKCGHEWRASPSNRTKGTGCPFCSNQKALAGYNDLQSRFPTIADEWHPTKNLGITPSHVVYSSNKKVWWLGKCGHEWEAVISKRTKLGRGCPICAKRLQTSFPEQALYYYIKSLFPDAINSYKECFDGEMELDIYLPSKSIGIEYDGSHWHDNYESKQREIEKYQVCQKHGIKLIRVQEDYVLETPNTCDICICATRHPSYTRLNEIIIQVLSAINTSTSVDTKRDEVEIRKQYVTGSSTQPFGVLFPELLEEWNYELNGNLNPDSFSVSSGISVWWKCKNCGYEWKTRIATRTQGVGCIKCGFAKRTQHRIANMIKNKGSLADNFPEIAAEWHPYKNKELSPKQVMSGSGKKCWWLCKKCGTEWEAVIMHRVRGKCGCPTCKKENKKKE